MTQYVNSVQPEWPFALLEQPSDEAKVTDRSAHGDPNALLTDLQHAALRWVASFD